jgi:crossover junction endodeoxyribonuclease RuvC
MRILGVDPGLNCTGYGLVAHDHPQTVLLEGGVIRTEAKASLEVRVATIAGAIRTIIRELEPDVLVVEALYAKYAHPQTAILMGHARGVVLLAAAERGLEVAAYPASLVKRALTGHGRASKEQVGTMVAHLLGLPSRPEPDDVTDALALCLCHTAPMRRDRRPGELPPKIAEAIAAQANRRTRRA